MLAMTQEREQFLTAKEAADVARVNIKTIYRWIYRHELRTHRPGGHGHYRILKSDLITYLEEVDGESVSTIDKGSNSVH